MKTQIIRNILKVLAVGATALLMATASLVLAYLSGWLFVHIPSYNGYTAVFNFALALISFAFALGIVYVCGCWIVRKGRFAR